MTNKSTRNIRHTKDNTYHHLRHLRSNKDIVLLSGDKDSSLVIMNKVDYVKKVNGMINEGIRQGKYEMTKDATDKDLEKFPSFLYCNFKSHPSYNDMRPVSNQPARFFTTAKTHKFDDCSSINANNLKLRPIIDQSNTFTYNAAKIVSDYLQPLAQNEYVIKDTLLFAEISKNDKLDPDEEYVSYDVESLFTSIRVSETINYIIKEIYENKVIKPMCKSKLIFRRLLEKLIKNCVFSVNDKLVKQVEGCPMGGAISVIMSGIYMKRMEKDCVAPWNPKLYKRYVDDTITKRKKNATIDELFANMNSHHQNIKLTVETNSTRFLDTAFNVNPDGSVTTKVFRKRGKFSAFWNSQIPKRYKRNNMNGDLHRAFKIASNFDAEVSIITKKYLDAGYPLAFLSQLLVILKRRMKTNQLYLTGCLKNVVKFYLSYLTVLTMSMMLKGLLIELKALLEAT